MEMMEAEARLKEITVEFEKNFLTVIEFNPGPLPGVSPTGERYVEVMQRGPRSEGDKTAPFSTAEECLSSYAAVLKSMLPSCPSSLYWRVRPEIDYWSRGASQKKDWRIYAPTGWRIYSRFLISDKPIKED